MSLEDAIVAAIAGEPTGELRGRTLLQKKLYFVSVLIGDDFGFSPYFYGPYSTSIADELFALVDAGFIDEQTDLSAGHSGPFGEYRLYRYRLTPASQSFLSSRRQQVDRYRPTLERINAGSISQNVNLLSIAAKVHLIVAERGRIDFQGIKKRASELGWSLSSADIRLVLGYLQGLKLASFHRDYRTAPAGL